MLSSDFSFIFLILFLIFAILTIFNFLNPIHKKTSIENKKIFKILEDRYVSGEMDLAEYTERGMILEDETSTVSSMVILKERYARGEIDSREFIKLRDDLKSNVNVNV
jgi:uncharacterized membrane protein